jgi:heme-degrading monooxygenase HmoA
MRQPNVGPDALVDEPVTLINLFTVPPSEFDRFLRGWRDSARIMATQPGFIRARMYCTLDAGVEPSFINVAEWESGKALDQATTNPEFRRSVQGRLDDPMLHVVGRPAIYQLSVEVRPHDPP